MVIQENETHIIEPFTGKGHLLQFIKRTDLTFELYDIDPKFKNTIKRDTLLNPPERTRESNYSVSSDINLNDMSLFDYVSNENDINVVR